MANSKNKTLRLGMLVAAGLFLFIITIYFLGSKQNLFSSTVMVKSYFNNVKGLVEGNKVRYSGITIGTVSEINIVSDSTVLVEMLIEKDVKEFIRKDSRVKIVSDGLMGSKIVEIQPGSSSAGSINDNDMLNSANSIDMDEILKEAKGVIEDGRLVAKNLVEISEKINNGNGDLAILLNENTISKKLNQTGDELLTFTKNLNDISGKINNGEGDLGRFINDTTYSHQIGELLVNIDSITVKADLFSEELLTLGRNLNSGNGIIQRLVYDSVMADNIDTAIVKVNYGIDNVAEAADAIESSWLLNLFSKKRKDREKDQ
ncbi:MlaD family protein [Maribellus maritimus]|uniref:MlaD family protein n=1 Tax=Maribellus maritimus TaxID=2870838 RepID=UPI001EEC87D7|nr:MlaD family protein [Maribellus maritimus]MCG6188356.1 MlaD family protein [Maribellus maritimus]